MPLTSSWPKRHGDHFFPPWFIWALFFLTSAFRVHYVMQPCNWWIVHPDEIYQTMEVAHTEVYGYGFRTYEFNPPIEIKSGIPDIRRQEYDHGMAALRSFLPPQVYVIVTWFLQHLGFDCSPFVTWKLAHTLMATCLLPAVFHYVKVVFRSHDTACLAAILCAACAQLHVLGTHTLVNSLLAPFVFLSLAQLHTLIGPTLSDLKESETENARRRQLGGIAETELKTAIDTIRKDLSRRNVSEEPDENRGKRRGKEKLGKNKNKTNGQLSSSTPSSSSHTHGDSTCVRNRNVSRLAKSTANGHPNRYGLTGCNKHRGLQDVQKSVMNGHGHVLEGTPPLLEFGKKMIVNGLSSRAALANGFCKKSDDAGWMILNTEANTRYSVLKSFLETFVAGFVMGVCVYVRIDIAAFVSISLVTHWRPFHTRYLSVFVSAIGAAGGVILCVLYDFRCYGWGVLTPYNWYKFNVERDYSSILFGTEEGHKYIRDIFFQNVGSTVLTLISCLCCVLNVIRALWRDWDGCGGDEEVRSTAEEDAGGIVRRRQSDGPALLQCGVSCFLLLLLYSCKGHKELRFVHNVIVLVMVTCAALLQSNLSSLSRGMQKLVIILVMIFFALSQWREVASLTDRSNKNNGNAYSFKRTSDTQDVNHCLYYISSCNDVTGVFIDRNLYGTGGYTLLHKDVPVFSLLDYNFYEYRVEDRQTEASKSALSHRQNLSVAYMSLFSNFLSAHNSRYVMKFVLEDARYNYLLMHATRDFDAPFGPPVFTCDTFKVYRRSKKPTKEQQHVVNTAVNMAPKVNASVLLHEADMLFFHGAWLRAAERFELALRVDPSRISSYLPLAVSYHRLGDKARASSTMTKCYKQFGRARCDTRRPMMTDVNADYS